MSDTAYELAMAWCFGIIVVCQAGILVCDILIARRDRHGAGER